MKSIYSDKVGQHDKEYLELMVAVGILVTWFVAPASAQSIDQNFYYKMSTQFRGPGMKLDVFNGGARNTDRFGAGSRCFRTVMEVQGER